MTYLAIFAILLGLSVSLASPFVIRITSRFTSPGPVRTLLRTGFRIGRLHAVA